MTILAKDLAKQIGVSTATLSLVLNGKPGISQKTREKVENEVRALGYGEMIRYTASNGTAPENIHSSSNTSPSPGSQSAQPAARSVNKLLSFILFKEHGKLLGMNSFFPLIFDGIESQARKYGYGLNVINIEKSMIDEQLNYIRNSGSSGFIIFATEMKEDMIEKFNSLQLPFVVFDNYFNDRDLYCAKVNNEQGTYIAVKHLYEMGHRRIGYLSSGLDIGSFHERQQRALDAMADFEIPCRPEDILTIGYPTEEAETGMDQVLKKRNIHNLPTAFLADNDLVSIGAMQSAKKHGFSLPQDFSFVGFDDRPLTTLIEPKLTTIQLPRHRFGSVAVDLLVEQIESPSEDYINVEINGKLICRESVANLN